MDQNEVPKKRRGGPKKSAAELRHQGREAGYREAMEEVMCVVDAQTSGEWGELSVPRLVLKMTESLVALRKSNEEFVELLRLKDEKISSLTRRQRKFAEAIASFVAEEHPGGVCVFLSAEARHRKIDVIKAVREVTRWSLIEAKNFVDSATTAPKLLEMPECGLDDPAGWVQRARYFLTSAGATVT